MSKIETLVSKINGGDNAAFRSLYGDDATVLKSMADRYIKFIDKFKSTYQTARAIWNRCDCSK